MYDEIGLYVGQVYRCVFIVKTRVYERYCKARVTGGMREGGALQLVCTKVVKALMYQVCVGGYALTRQYQGYI